jgi:hypothetical protein
VWPCRRLSDFLRLSQPAKHFLTRI